MKKNTTILVFVSILVIGIILSPMFTQATPAQKLDFYVKDFMIEEYKNDPVQRGNTIHIKDYNCTHIILEGSIGDAPIEGYAISYFHVKHNLDTNQIQVNGITIFYITWKEYTGGFSGPKNMQIDLNADPSAGEYLLTGIYNFQGFGDFEGWKINGIIYGFVQVNFFEGAVLIPN